MWNLTKSKQNPEAGGKALAPFGDFPFFLSRMRDEFDRMLENLPMPWPTGDKNGWRWGLDVAEEDNAVVVRAEAPGFEAGDFDLQVADDRLTLRAARKTETKDKEGKSREYRELESYQAVTLPVSVDREKVKAEYRNGILTVTLPKSAESKSRKIAVKAS